jgi:hypothetical protein
MPLIWLLDRRVITAQVLPLSGPRIQRRVCGQDSRGETLEVTRVIDGIAGPNDLCFSPDETTLYVVEGAPSRTGWSGPTR